MGRYVTLEVVLDCSDPEELMGFWREALGARRLHAGVRSFGPTRWVTMADPENNEFCVSTGVEW